MQLLGTVLILACSAAYAYAAVAIYPAESKPAGFECQEGCYLKSLGRVLSYNVPYYPEGQCTQYTCKTNNETQLFSCGAEAVGPNCRLVQDLTQKYPDCCGKPVCDTDTTTTTDTEDSGTGEIRDDNLNPERVNQIVVNQ